MKWAYLGLHARGQ